MTSVLDDSVPYSADPRISGLIEGGKWDLSGSRTLTYSFHDTEYGTWTAAGQAMFVGALQAWSNVANINFAATSIPTSTPYYSSTADLAFSAAGTFVADQGAVAMGIFPDSGWGDFARSELGLTESQYRQPEGDIAIDQRYLFYAPGQGDYGFMVALHELGHTLGLKHPHDDGGNGKLTFTQLGISSLDTGYWTVMSYNDTNTQSYFGGYQSTPMPLDILAIQHIYGANTSYHAGNDTYRLTADAKIQTIWDAGGADTLDASGLSSGLNLDLNEGAENTINSNTLVAIAYNVVIENAIGSSGNDVITGNAADNSLSGGAGADTLDGGAGNDTLNGGAGADLLKGGLGDDVYTLTDTLDTIVDDGGTDTVVTSLAAYSLANFSSVENLRASGSAGFSGTGNALANVLTGTSAADTLDGGAGDDTLGGGAGNDTLIGGAGNDLYLIASTGKTIVETAGGGSDTVRTSLTSFVLTNNVEALEYSGTAAVTFVGNAQANTLTGGSGNDTLDGGAGADTLNGGAGDDLYQIDNAGDVVIDSAGIDTIATTLSSLSLAGYDSVDRLRTIGSGAVTFTGNALANVITGGSGADTLDGGDGSDTLDGGAGADTLIGGAGHDLFLVNDAGDVVIEQAGGGSDSVQCTAASYTLGANVENLTYTGLVAVAVTFTGNDETNIITGGSGNDTLDGGSGADTLNGGAGNDLYRVDDAGDVIIDSAGVDTVEVTVSGYTLSAGIEQLRFVGTGSFRGTGTSASDTLVGGAGDDTLDGAVGIDTLIGGAGDDTYVVDNAADVVVEAAGQGADTIDTTLASYTLGSASIERLRYTGAGAALLAGNALANTLVGGAGNDTLRGGGGADVLAGGAGNDLYEIASGLETISENAGEGVDTVRTALAAWTLDDNVEVLVYTGTAAFTGTGSAQSNTLSGGAGADTLDGGAGADTLIGGTGNDTYVVDDAGDVVSETATGGNDTIVAMGASYSLANAVNVENLRYGGSGSFTGTGDGNANTLQGGAGDDVLDGGAGADWLIGGAGDDTYVVDAAGDVTVEVAGQGQDRVVAKVAVWTLGNNFEVLEYGGSGVFTGIGNAADNTLIGGAGGDTLTGGGGSDTLMGGGGDDLYLVTSGLEAISEAAGSGFDVARGAVATWTLADNVETYLYTGSGPARVTGNAGANLLTGGGGGDTLDGGAGADLMIGGGGDDTYVIDDVGDQAVELPGDGTDTAIAAGNFGSLQAMLGVENLTFGGAGDFVGIGNALDNVLTGGAGNDILDGGAGNDTLDGGAGDDLYRLDSIGDVVVDSGGTDTIETTLTSFDLSTVADVENLRHVGPTAFVGLGNDLANTLVGGDGADRLDGGLGGDLLQGGRGNDLLYGGSGDTLEGGAGNDVFVVTEAGVTVVENAGEGADTIRTSLDTYTLAANVETLVYTGTGNFTGTGSAGNDTLIGGGGADTLSGGMGDDWLNGGAGADTLNGGSGHDTVDYRAALAGVSVDLAAGTAEDGWGSVDVLSGIENALGSAGADFLRAANAGSRLDGGRGDDTLDGNSGSDVFVFGLGGGHDTVLDFDAAVDVLDLTGFHLSVDVLLAHVIQQGGDSILALDEFGGGQVQVVGVNLLEARHLLA